MPPRRLRLLTLPAAIVLSLAAVAPAAAPPPARPRAHRSAPVRGPVVAVIRRQVLLRDAPGGRALARIGPRTEWGTPRVLAVTGRRGPWLRVLATELPNGSSGWIATRAVRFEANPWAVRVSIARRRVTVLRRGRVVRRFSVAVGATATPTPTGRFAVTDKLTPIGGGGAYGCCALALSGRQPHIAQGWRGGDRLAIHGTSEPATIGRAASLGCLRARERDVHWIVAHVFLGTIVDIRR